MKNRVLVVLSMAVGLLLFSGPLFAHHSDSLNDMDHLIIVTGTVTEWQFINPHALIHFDVKDSKGNVEKWIAYGGSPTSLRRIRWSPNTFKPGEKITLTGFRYKDGKPVMLQVKVVRENGEVVPPSDAGESFLRNFEAKYGEANRIKIN